MKKNTMMRLASALLVLVLLTTCAISGTFAKYVTTNSGDDEARVAKWGVTITTTGEMFGDAYKDEVVTYEANEKKDTITVQADTEGTDVVAPGTNGTLAAFDIAGTPEVDTEVTYTADLVLTGWEVDSAVYCPIVFNVNGTEIKIDATNTTTAKLEEAVEAAIVGATQKYHTNEDLSAVENDLVVTWAWAFEGDDVKDTALGDAAAGLNGGTAATIKLTVSATITQVN